MVTLNPPPFNNAINVFQYEGFNFAVPNPSDLSFTLQPVSNTAGLDPTSLYFTKNGNLDISFSVSDLSNRLSTGTETFKVTVLDASGTSFVSSNTVTINPGRFLDQFGQTLSNRSFTFYRNEPIAPGTIRLVAPSFPLLAPTSFLSLPPGFRFSRVASNIFDIVGTPNIAFGNSNYQIIGVQDGGSKLVTTRFNIVVSNERLRVDPAIGSIISNMQIGTAITPIVITTNPPAVGGTTIEYTFPALPDGIVVTDVFGNPQPSGITFFRPPSEDASFTMIIGGTPTLAAANTFAGAGIGPDGSNISIVARRISPIPQISNTIDLKFQFAPTVLFDPPTIGPIYIGIPVNQSTNFFKAYTYFAAAEKLSNIVSISSSNLRSDLSLVHVPGNPRADLSGNNPGLPTGTSTFTVRAEDSSGNLRNLVVSVNVLNDFITFQPPTPVDTCYNFIVSRPVSLAKTGYYPSNIQFKAIAASGLSVELSAPALVGTGLSLDASGIIVGVPTEVTPLSTLSVVANAIGSPATGSRDVQFAILDDIFTFADVSASKLSFIQNIRISDVGFPVTTLSDRNVIGYSQTGLPLGLSINSAGIVSGTPTTAVPSAGNATITATTGFASGSRDFSYNITPDAVLLFSPVSPLDMVANQTIGPLQIQGVSYSGKTVSNYEFVGLSETYGLTIGSSTGLLNGTLESGFPPDPLFPLLSNFQIKASAGDVSANLNVTFQTLNGFVNRSFVALESVALVVGSESNTTSIYASDNYSNWFLVPPFSSQYPITDFHVKYTDPNSNEVNYLQSLGIERYTNGPAFTLLPNRNLLRAFTTDGSGTWWGVADPSIVLTDINDIDPPAREIPIFKGTLLQSLDNGVTWADLYAIPGVDLSATVPNGVAFSPRLAVDDSFTAHPYRTMGISLRYKEDVLLLGGIKRELYEVGKVDPISVTTTALMRSIDNGETWTSPTDFAEIAGFNLDASGIWLAYGSESHQTDGPYVRDPDSGVTIKYSTDLGATWSNATGTSDYFTYDVTYGNGTWIATGVDQSGTDFIQDVRFSTNGSNWQPINLTENVLFPFVGTPPVPPIGVGPTMFNGTSWNMFVVRPQVPLENDPLVTEVYTHDTVSDLSTNWTAIQTNFPVIPPEENTSNRPTRLFLGYTPDNLIKQNGTPMPFLTFGGGTGPTFTSPTTTSYLQYQYMTIPPIQIRATGVGQVYYFATTSTLPPGLSFDPITARITGAPVRIGTDSVTVFAKDDIGTSQIVIGFNTVIPRIIRKQDGAAAYTSLLRQYTEVVAAQSARDNRAVPTEMRTLGEFMSPVPPPVVSPSNCPC